MKSFKSFVLAALVAVCGMGAVAVVDSPIAGTQKAEAAPGKYIVWYQKGNQRWTGISGLSYRDACYIRDTLIRKGYRAYVSW